MLKNANNQWVDWVFMTYDVCMQVVHDNVESALRYPKNLHKLRMLSY